MRSIAVLALVALAACDRSPTAPANRLLVTAFVTPDTIRVGEATNVIVAITNVSDQPQTYESNFCGPAYHVYTAAGTQLDGARPCLDITQPKTLAPGAQDVYAQQWAATAGSSAGPLPAGAYTIRGVISGDGVENLPYAVQLVP